MKKIILLVLAISFYPFACTGQTTVKVSENCDTITIEQPGYQNCVDDLLECSDSLTVVNEQLQLTEEELAQREQELIDEKVKVAAGTLVIVKLNTDLEVARDSLEVCLTTPPIECPDPIICPPVVGLPENEIDTIIRTTCWGYQDKDKAWVHEGDINEWPHIINIPFQTGSMTKVNFVDSLTVFRKKYQERFRLKRIKKYAEAKTTYKDDGVPFQFYITDSIKEKTSTSFIMQTFGSEDHGIKYYVDGVLFRDGSDAIPGQVEIGGGTMYRHTGRITGLQPETNYMITVIGKGRVKDEIETYDFWIWTDPEVSID